MPSQNIFYQGENVLTYTKDNIVFEPKPTHFNFKDHTNKIVNRLTFLGVAGRDKKNRILWFLECHCTVIFVAHGTDIFTKGVQSCGCLSSPKARAIRSTTHGMRHTPEYNIYKHAQARCNNPNDARYKDYGQRGIECRFTSFEEFFAEVGKKPTPEHSIDRIDVNGHYEIGNVRWATRIEQARNTRSNRYLTCNGRTQILIEWANELGVCPAAILYRLKQGWSEDKALSTPFRKITKKI